MFLEASKKARKFTFPVVISQKTVDGKCFGVVVQFEIRPTRALR